MAQRGLPQHIKVDEFYYEIVSWKQKDAQDVDRYGETSLPQKIIRIDESYGPRQAAETLIHELLHILFYRRGVQRERNEEHVVKQIAHGLAAVIHDNPALGPWLFRRLR
jgi:hypothetical protein